jgi:hypothetical protein
METIAVFGDRKKFRRLLVTCAVFAVISVWMIATGQVLGGLACLIIFGGGGILFYLTRMRDPKPTFELSPAGLLPIGGGVVPWRDIEGVGVGQLARLGQVVGVRLSDYTAYVQSIPEDMEKWKKAVTWGAARAVSGPPAFDRASPAEAANGEQAGTANGDLRAGPKGDLVALLLWNRKKTGGWDICWGHQFLSEPPQTIVNMILAYQAKALET